MKISFLKQKQKWVQILQTYSLYLSSTPKNSSAENENIATETKANQNQFSTWRNNSCDSSDTDVTTNESEKSKSKSVFNLPAETSFGDTLDSTPEHNLDPTDDLCTLM